MMRKPLFITLGTFFMILGIIGIILPLLPTTPMLLLTAYFYSKGSPKFHKWFTRTWLYKKYLKNYAETRSMTIKGKIKLMILVDTMLLIPFITISYLPIRILIIILVITKHLYFFTQVKTIEDIKTV